MEAVPFILFLLLVFGVPEFWLIAWSARLFKRKKPLSIALGIGLGVGALVWPVAFFGGVDAIVAGGITTTR